MTLTDRIIAGVAVLALLMSSIAALYGRRAARSADRSEAVARRAAEFAAGEQSARRKLAEDHAIRWRLMRNGAATNDLVNIGDKPAYDVRVQVPEGMDLLGLQTERAEIPSGASLTLGVSRSRMISGNGVIRVLWRDAPDAADREWSHPPV